MKVILLKTNWSTHHPGHLIMLIAHYYAIMNGYLTLVCNKAVTIVWP